MAAFPAGGGALAASAGIGHGQNLDHLRRGISAEPVGHGHGAFRSTAADALDRTLGIASPVLDAVPGGEDAKAVPSAAPLFIVGPAGRLAIRGSLTQLGLLILLLVWLRLQFLNFYLK